MIYHKNRSELKEIALLLRKIKSETVIGFFNRVDPEMGAHFKKLPLRIQRQMIVIWIIERKIFWIGD